MDESIIESKQMGILSRFINIIFEPTKVFLNIIEKQIILVPIIIIILGLLALIIPKGSLSEEYSRNLMTKIYSSEQFAKTQPITKDQMNKNIDLSVKVQKIASYFSPILVVLTLLIQTVIFYLVFKAFGGAGGFKQTFAVFIYSYFINLIGECVRTINVLITGNIYVANSFGLLMQDDKTSYIYNFINAFDFFGLWAIIVSALGLSIVHKVSTKKSYIICIVLFLVFVIVMSGYTTFSANQMFKQYGITI